MNKILPFSNVRWVLKTLRTPAALSLVVLVIQNSVLVVMTKLSKQRVTEAAAAAGEGGIPQYKPYHTSTLVLNQELLKMVFCLALFTREWRTIREKRLHQQVSPSETRLYSPTSTVVVVGTEGWGAANRGAATAGQSLMKGAQQATPTQTYESKTGGIGTPMASISNVGGSGFEFPSTQIHSETQGQGRSTASAHVTESAVRGFFLELSYQVLQWDTLKLLIPAALFTMQNYLIFVALTYLDAMTFQMLSQSKLISAAILSVLILGKKLKLMQWVSLGLLTLGVYLSQGYQSATIAAGARPHPPPYPSAQFPFPPPSKRDLNALDGIVNGLVEGALALAGIQNPLVPLTTATTTTTTTATTTQAPSWLNFGGFFGGGTVLLGAMACLLSGISSSFAGVYFEKVVKTTPPSLAVRNIHLSLFGIPLAFISMLIIDVAPTLWGMSDSSAESKLVAGHGNLTLLSGGRSVAKAAASNIGKSEGFSYWQGYDALTFALVFVHAIGGLLVAVVVKYADNILKGFATAIAIVVSGAYMMVFTTYVPSTWFVFGCSLVCVATILYQVSENKGNR